MSSETLSEKLSEKPALDVKPFQNIPIPRIPAAVDGRSSRTPSVANQSGVSTPRNPFSSSSGSSLRNPFSDRDDASSYAPSSVAFSRLGSARRYFYSRRTRKEDIERPWTQKKDPRQKWLSIIPLLGLLIGIGVSAIDIWFGLRAVPEEQFCSIYEDDFSNGFNENIWSREVQVGGFGNGQFEEATGTDENSFVSDGMLYIKPTLQDPSLIENDNVLNLTALGTCTSAYWWDCVSTTNTTNGTIVNPVKSARITTKKGASIKFGKIEVVAQMPAGDWMWPAIWLLPVEEVYGPWPASGEIDMIETRGNNHTYASGGNNIMSSTLHWGPDLSNDAWWRTTGKQAALHSSFASKFHTYGLQWTPKYLFIYLDTQLLQVVYNQFSEPLWQRGQFPVAAPNGSAIVDPWSQTGSDATPFDIPFYLILDVGVGATNGWFADGVGGKPWVDASPTARLDFWNARDQWYPTWQDDGEMKVKSVKMWQLKGYNGCS